MSQEQERTLPYGLDPSKIAPASSQVIFSVKRFLFFLFFIIQI
jgi:hypothetical protein